MPNPTHTPPRRSARDTVPLTQAMALDWRAHAARQPNSPECRDIVVLVDELLAARRALNRLTLILETQPKRCGQYPQAIAEARAALPEGYDA